MTTSTSQTIGPWLRTWSSRFRRPCDARKPGSRLLPLLSPRSILGSPTPGPIPVVNSASCQFNQAAIKVSPPLCLPLSRIKSALPALKAGSTTGQLGIPDTSAPGTTRLLCVTAFDRGQPFGFWRPHGCRSIAHLCFRRHQSQYAHLSTAKRGSAKRRVTRRTI
jgi:hypothetical protein